MAFRFTGLWHNADFVKLWAGQTISQFGTLMGALQFTAILVLDAKPFQMALLTASGTAPALLIGLAAGVWVDRMRRRPILIAADLGRAALLLSIPIAYFADKLIIEQLYVVSFLTGTLTIFFDIAYPSYVPSLVKREELVEANSKLTASASVVEVGAFSLGGWIAQLFSAITSVVVDALSFLASGFLLLLVRAREPAPSKTAERPPLWREAWEGLGFLAGNIVLRAMIISTVAMGLASGIIGGQITLYGIRELGIPPGVLGTVYATGGISSLLGAIIAARVTRRLGLGPSIVTGMMAYGLVAMLVPLAPKVFVLAIVFMTAAQMADGLWTIHEIAKVSLRQSITPSQWMGRVNGSLRVMGLIAMLVGSLLGGLLAERVGLRFALFIGASMLLVGGLLLLLTPLRTLREPPRPVEQQIAS